MSKSIEHSTGIRKTLYLRKSKDQDILEFIKPLLELYDFATVIRELVRDGIKLRQGEQTKHRISVVNSSTERLSSPQVLQSHTSDFTSDIFNDVVLAKSEISNEEIENRLDNF